MSHPIDAARHATQGPGRFIPSQTRLDHPKDGVYVSANMDARSLSAIESLPHKGEAVGALNSGDLSDLILLGARAVRGSYRNRAPVPSDNSLPSIRVTVNFAIVDGEVRGIGGIVVESVNGMPLEAQQANTIAGRVRQSFMGNEFGSDTPDGVYTLTIHQSFQSQD